MRNLFKLGLLAVLGFAGWQLLSQFKIEGWDNVRLVPRDAATGASASNLPVQRSGDTVRVASFNIQVLGSTKINKPEVVDVLARIIRQFDVVAVQEVRSSDQDILPRLVEAVNAAGRHYDYAIGPRLPLRGPEQNREQYAYIFDQASLELDRLQLYTIDDPDDLLAREPLVGWFRVRGPPTGESFTFSLVNLHTDPDIAVQEVAQLPKIYEAVLNDGREEDDVIILGDFNIDERGLSSAAGFAGITCLITGVPTNTRGTQQYDNIVLQQHATSEFVGRAGTYDFMREMNLSLERALDVSDHLPVWAEFSIFEGGRPGTVAALPGTVR